MKIEIPENLINKVIELKTQALAGHEDIGQQAMLFTSAALLIEELAVLFASQKKDEVAGEDAGSAYVEQ